MEMMSIAVVAVTTTKSPSTAYRCALFAWAVPKSPPVNSAGSCMTSSRSEFLDQVDADLYVVSSGPKVYGSVTLPDPAIITELTSRGSVFRTDVNDPGCATNGTKIGPDNDGFAGGCDNVIIQIQASQTPTATTQSFSD